MSVIIPTFTDSSHYRQEIELDLKSYIVEILWNSRKGQWSISFLNPDETPVILGLALVMNYDILAQYRNIPNMIQGSLYCIDTTGKEREINRDNLGKTILLTYTGVDE